MGAKLSKQDKIIIGVVVPVVSILAILLGLYFGGIFSQCSSSAEIVSIESNVDTFSGGFYSLPVAFSASGVYDSYFTANPDFPNSQQCPSLAPSNEPYLLCPAGTDGAPQYCNNTYCGTWQYTCSNSTNNRRFSVCNPQVYPQECNTPENPYITLRLSKKTKIKTIVIQIWSFSPLQSLKINGKAYNLLNMTPDCGDPNATGSCSSKNLPLNQNACPAIDGVQQPCCPSGRSCPSQQDPSGGDPGYVYVLDVDECTDTISITDMETSGAYFAMYNFWMYPERLVDVSATGNNSPLPQVFSNLNLFNDSVSPSQKESVINVQNGATSNNLLYDYTTGVLSPSSISLVPGCPTSYPNVRACHSCWMPDDFPPAKNFCADCD